MIDDRRPKNESPAHLVTNLSEEHFWAFFESAPIPMKILDPEGNILRINAATNTFLGYESAELVGCPIFAIMCAEEAPGAQELYRELISRRSEHQRQRAEYEHHMITDRRYKKKAGDFVWANLYLLAFWNSDGSLRHVVGTMVDITDRKARAHEKAELERTILDTTIDGIMTLGTTGLIEVFNRASEQLFGYAADEVIGQDAAMLIAPTNRDAFGRFLRTAPSPSPRQAFEGLRKDGSCFPLEVSIGEMTLGEDRKVTAIVRDISERVSFIERLRRSERMGAIGQLAGGIAHDFNNVLSIITSYSYLIQSMEGLPEDADEFVGKIFEATERGARLTGQVMALSPNPLTTPQPLVLNDVVLALEEIFHSVLEEDIAIITELEASLPPVEADLGQMEQILLNLTLNARDAMPEGGTLTIKTSSVRIDLGRSPASGPHQQHRLLKPGEYTVVKVQDTGVGISPETRDRIFDPFFTTKSNGTGLGLATVLTIIERHDGIITVGNAEGGGSVFSVYLPTTRDQAPDLTQRENHAPGEAVEVRGSTILIVEDEVEIREALVRVLQSHNYKVLAAADGQQALEIAGAHPGTIDLLLTDVILPGINGVELAERLTQTNPSLRVLFISGYAGEALHRKRLTANQVHLAKPFDLHALIGMVGRLLSP